jgi:hypothetical protein
MMKIIWVATAALTLGVSTARADSRLVDGLMGAGAGALVAGPVGLVAGGVIGYSAGPHISCSLRDECRRRHYHRHERD